MSLKERINDDMKAAMKAGDAERLSVIRMARAAVQNARIAKRRDLSEEETLEVIGREVNKRRQAAQEYRRLAQESRAAAEDREADILEAYLPRQLAEAEIEDAVRAAMAEVGAQGLKDLGRVMAAVMPRVKGRADGKRVNETARRLLGE